MFREVPSHFYYLVYFSKEETSDRELHDPPPCKIIKYANEILQPKLPESLCRLVKSLLNNTSCGYSIRCHNTANKGEAEDECSNVLGEHYHVLFYIKSFVGAEKFIKDTISNNLLNPQKGTKIISSLVKLFKVSYPENCLQTEAQLGGNRLFIHGEKMKSILKMKPTTDLGCSYEMSWELQRSCYTEFDESEDIEKLSFLSKQLAELEKSPAVFKDSVLDFIELLMRGFGTIKASHHNNVLSVDLGFSDAQCQCFECQDNSTSFCGASLTANEHNECNLFSFVDENAQFL